MKFNRLSLSNVQASEIKDLIEQLNNNLQTIQRNFEMIQQLTDDDTTVTHELMLGAKS